MKIIINEQDVQGEINIAEKITGKGVINHYSWAISSNSSSIILEIADDPMIAPDDLPLVGFGCAGWLFESNIEFDKVAIRTSFFEGVNLFRENKLKYIPAVTCSCSDL